MLTNILHEQKKFIWILIVIGTLWISSNLANFDIIKIGSLSNWKDISVTLHELTSPNFSADFIKHVLFLSLESILIAALGMVLALIVALCLSPLATHPFLDTDNPSYSSVLTKIRRVIRTIAASILLFFRSIPEILWAFVFVRIFGLGAGPAIFAIGITFGGIIGKMFAELIESADPRPSTMLKQNGAGTFVTFWYGIFPQIRTPWLSYVLFRFECALRSAAILGVVGAGGIGSEIELSIRYFQYDNLATALLCLLFYLIIIETIVIRFRKTHPKQFVMALCIISLVAIFGLNIPWGALFTTDAYHQISVYLMGFKNPLLTQEFIFSSLSNAIDTILMALCATLGAGIMAILLAPMASSKFTLRSYLPDSPEQKLTLLKIVLLIFGVIPIRGLFQITRAIPDLIWALFFILWVGPGITAGILALSIHTFGILGRLYSDTFEDATTKYMRLIEETGGKAFVRYVYGILPQTMPTILSFTIFRFEVNIRNAVMIGFIGAGGIGDSIHTAISLFHMRELTTLLIVLLFTVAMIEALSNRIRSYITSAKYR